jgi:hypothetical protein
MTFNTFLIAVCSLQRCKTSGLQLTAERPKTAVIKTFKIFLVTPLFQQVSCDKDVFNSVCNNAKQR